MLNGKAHWWFSSGLLVATISVVVMTRFRLFGLQKTLEKMTKDDDKEIDLIVRTTTKDEFKTRLKEFGGLKKLVEEALGFLEGSPQATLHQGRVYVVKTQIKHTLMFVIDSNLTFTVSPAKENEFGYSLEVIQQ